MSSLLNISVSKLTAFDDYLHGRWNQEDDTRLRQYLLGLSEKTYEQSLGDAIHGLVEYPEQLHGDGTINGIRIPERIVDACITYRNSLPQPFLFEQWLPQRILNIAGYQVKLRARIDILCPDGIRDIKTTSSSFSYDRYADSYQWRYYLWMSGFQQFDYDVFRFTEKETNVKYYHIRQYAYSDLEKDCLRLIEGLVTYCQNNDLLHTLQGRMELATI